MNVDDMRAIFGEPVEGRDYHEMPDAHIVPRSMEEIQAIEAAEQATPALPVTGHILGTLRALEESAIADHVALDAAGLPGPAEAMAQRADMWRQLAGVVDLFDDPHFVAAYIDMTDAKAQTAAVTERPADPRAAALADAHQMLDFLAANPELPIGPYALNISAHPKGTDADRMDAVDQAAKLLGAKAGNNGPAGYHYQASKEFGSVSYTVAAISSDPAVKVLARNAVDAYELDEVRVIRAELDNLMCPRCGYRFAEGVPTVPVFYDAVGGDLLLHASCAEARAGNAVDGDADLDFEFAPMSAEDYAAEQAAFDAANVDIAARLARERRRAAAQDCEDSCGGEGVCAFGPHDPITTQPTPSTTGATDEP